MLGHNLISTWEEMKHAMGRRLFLHNIKVTYENILQRLTQGSPTIEEYCKEMESLLVCSWIYEDESQRWQDLCMILILGFHNL